MKRVIYLILVIPLLVSAQNLLNNPESIIYDHVSDSYIVSNWGNGALVRIDSVGNQSYFSTQLQGMFSAVGLHVYGDTLLVAYGNAPNPGIGWFDLATGAMIDNTPIPGIGLPNGVTSDVNGIIYVTDYWGDKLYRIVDHVPELLWDHDLGNPNGQCYDAENHRLLIISVGGAGTPVLAFDIADSSLSTVINTYLGGGDGIVFDSNKNLYISEWTNDCVHKLDSTLTNPPVVFSSGHNDPADIYYDVWHDQICVPNFSSQSIDFVPVNPIFVQHDPQAALPRSVSLLSNYPNPFNSSTVIPFELQKASEVRLSIYNIKGNLIATLVDGFMKEGRYQTRWQAENLPSGIYFIRLQTDAAIKTNRTIILR